jgi:hypothetical protein
MQGMPGDKGVVGDKGAVGDKGSQGDKGVIGDKGTAGDKLCIFENRISCCPCIYDSSVRFWSRCHSVIIFIFHFISAIYCYDTALCDKVCQ